MSLDAAIDESLLLEACRLEQRNRIYRTDDGHRVYVGGFAHRACLIDDMQKFTLLRGGQQAFRQAVMRAFVIALIPVCLGSFLFPEQVSRFRAAFVYGPEFLLCVAALVTNGLMAVAQSRSLYSQFPLAARPPSLKVRLDQRRAVAKGELPSPLRGR